ncbi:caspase family protein [uncultured Rhodospira sp.]|uniref:caspase family protein n=1 Tax=uncultured Rhodospira sp. TaxID=1936189 RepID=UPI00260D7D5E|nr:caspase family protein [uncultured Rhodospira sp.]
MRRFAPAPLACLIAVLVCGAGVVAAYDAAAQTSVLRNSTRSVGRAVQSQTRTIFRPTLQIRGNLGAVRGLDIDAGWAHAATVLGNGAIALWDLREGAEVQRLTAAGMGPVRDIHVGPNGGFVLLGSTDRQARVLPAPGGRPVAGLPSAASSNVQSVNISPDGRQAIFGRSDGTVLGVTLASGQAQSLHRGAGAVTHVARDDGGRFAAAFSDGSLVIGAAGAGRSVRPAAPVSALAMSADGRVVAGLSNGTVEIWDAASGQRIAQARAHDAEVTAVSAAPGGLAVSGDSNGGLAKHSGGQATRLPTPVPGPVTDVAMRSGPDRILAASGDGTVHVLDGQSFRLLAHMISNAGGWAVVSPEGRYDGAIDTYEDVVWSTPAGDLPVDRFAKTYFEPGLLTKSVQPGMALSTRPSVAIQQEVRLPPEVTVSVSPSGGVAPGETVTVTVKAVNRSDGTRPDVRLYNNDKRVPPEAIVADINESGDGVGRTVTFAVPAVPGRNAFSAVALGWQGVASDPATASVQASGGGVSGGQLYLTAVGINAYQAAGLGALTFAVADAQSVSQLFQRGVRTPYSGVRQTLLTNRQATKSAIRAHLQSLQTISPSDVLILYLAGHGKALDSDWYFLPADLSQASASGVRSQGISAEELADLLRRIPAQKMLLLVDACGAGAALSQFDGFEQRRFLDSLSRETGVHVLTAARAGQEAPEYDILGHGLFTYAFLEGFGAGGGVRRADRAPRDGQVTVVEIKSYVEDAVPVVVQKLEEQLLAHAATRGGIAGRTMVTPVGISRGTDFVLAR